MIIVYTVQVICALLSVVSLGHSMRKDATKFDKISYSVVSIVYLIMCFGIYLGIQGVK